MDFVIHWPHLDPHHFVEHGRGRNFARYILFSREMTLALKALNYLRIVVHFLAVDLMYWCSLGGIPMGFHHRCPSRRLPYQHNVS